jgi:hypothetical protein
MASTSHLQDFRTPPDPILQLGIDIDLPHAEKLFHISEFFFKSVSLFHDLLSCRPDPERSIWEFFHTYGTISIAPLHPAF